jgi:hypothetical protein
MTTPFRGGIAMSEFDELMGPARAAPERAAADHAGPAEARGAAVAPDAAAVLRLQRTAGNAGVAQLMAGEVQRDDDPHGLGGLVGAGGGSPLPDGTRLQMESAFGTDFWGVRVHTGAEADASARSLGAHAYTAGNDVVFANGRYDPVSDGGQRTLAHELTHVVQQRSGPVEGTDNGNGVRVSDPGDRFEQAAESSAEHVVAGRAADGGDLAPPATTQALDVQREGDEEAGDVQMMAVQREAGGEEPEEAPEEEPEDVQTMAVQREEDAEEAEEPAG